MTTPYWRIATPGAGAIHPINGAVASIRDTEVRRQLHTLAYNLATFLRCIELPEAMADRSLTSLRLKLIKTGARVVRHARAKAFQMAEVAVTGPMVRAILAAIRRFRAFPRPRTSFAAKNICSVGKIRRLCRLSAGHLGNVG